MGTEAAQGERSVIAMRSTTCTYLAWQTNMLLAFTTKSGDVFLENVFSFGPQVLSNAIGNKYAWDFSPHFVQSGMHVPLR